MDAWKETDIADILKMDTSQYTKSMMGATFEKDDVIGPDLRWDELNPMVRKVKIEEESLRRMLKSLKEQEPNYNSDILIRLIELELKDPRL